MNYSINLTHGQISRKDAANIMGFSVAELDRRRIADPRCPKGFKERDDKMCPVKFRLSDVYTYSAVIMDSAVEAKTG